MFATVAIHAARNSRGTSGNCTLIFSSFLSSSAFFTGADATGVAVVCGNTGSFSFTTSTPDEGVAAFNSFDFRDLHDTAITTIRHKNATVRNTLILIGHKTTVYTFIFYIVYVKSTIDNIFFTFKDYSTTLPLK